MNLPNSFTKVVSILLMVSGGVKLCAASRSDIVTTVQRAEVLTKAAGILAQRVYKYPAPSDETNNPFSPSDLFSQDEDPSQHSKSTRPTSDHDLLVLLVSQLNPTGTLLANGEAILTFGQKKVKIGERLPIVFDNQTYELELINIERTTFTVRFNNEELSRPIKPGKNP